MKKDDSLWKGILEDVFPHFLRFVFSNAHDLFDFKKGFMFLDKELNELFSAPKKPSGQRFVDKLVQVSLKDGKKQWLLIHIEVVRLVSRLFNCFNLPPGRTAKPVFL